MRAAAWIIRIVALLGLLGWGGLVGLTIVSKGWFGGLALPLAAAAIFAVYFVIGLRAGSKPRAFSAVLGMLMTVPLVSAVAAGDRWEPRSLLLGGVPAAILGLCSLIVLLKSRKPPTPS